MRPTKKNMCLVISIQLIHLFLIFQGTTFQFLNVFHDDDESINEILHGDLILLKDLLVADLDSWNPFVLSHDNSVTIFMQDGIIYVGISNHVSFFFLFHCFWLDKFFSIKCIYKHFVIIFSFYSLN